MNAPTTLHHGGHRDPGIFVCSRRLQPDALGRPEGRPLHRCCYALEEASLKQRQSFRRCDLSYSSPCFFIRTYSCARVRPSAAAALDLLKRAVWSACSIIARSMELRSPATTGGGGAAGAAGGGTAAATGISRSGGEAAGAGAAGAATLIARCSAVM